MSDVIALVNKAIDHIRVQDSCFNAESIAQRSGIAIGMASAFLHVGLIDKETYVTLNGNAEFMRSHALKQL